MTQQHSPGPWPMHMKHVYGTRDSDEMSGLGWEFDDDLNPPTPQLRGVLSKAADAKLVERTHEVPHECDLPGCPGPVNKRKLEAFDELLAALDGLLATEANELGSALPNCSWCQEWLEGVECTYPECPGVRARAAIAKASPQAQ